MRLCWLRRHLRFQNRDCHHDAVRSLHLVYVPVQPNALRPAVGPFDDLGDGGFSPFHALGDSFGSTNRYQRRSTTLSSILKTNMPSPRQRSRGTALILPGGTARVWAYLSTGIPARLNAVLRSSRAAFTATAPPELVRSCKHALASCLSIFTSGEAGAWLVPNENVPTSSSRPNKF